MSGSGDGEGSVGTVPEPVTSDAPVQDRASAARAAAGRRRSKAWRYQLIGAAFVVVVLVVAIGAVWRTSEIRAVRSDPASSAPTPLASGAVVATPALAWRTTDRLASGEAVYENVVITYAGHGVTGRDAATGAVRWSYTRSDRLLCSVIAQDSAVVAIYSHDDLCDEVTGLDAGSGRRIWVRTLLTSVRPGTLTVSSFNGNVLLASPGSLELIEPTGGLDWWLDQPTDGCSVRAAVLGVSGVLISSRCLTGDTLSFRALGSAKERAWTLPLTGRTPLSADTLISTMSSDGRTIDLITAANGQVTAQLPLTSAISPADSPRAAPADSTTGVELIAVQGGVIATTGRATDPIIWRRAGLLPTAGPTPGTLLSAGSASVTEIDATQGTSLHSFAVSSATATDRVLLLGTGLALGSSAGTVVYR